MQICNMLSIDDPACYMYCVYNMQHASSWRCINTYQGLELFLNWADGCLLFNNANNARAR
jgi:hypothetical protein